MSGVKLSYMSFKAEYNHLERTRGKESCVRLFPVVVVVPSLFCLKFLFGLF